MARIPRELILSDNSYFHVTWQCHNHSYFFSQQEIKKIYYELLLKYKDQYGIKIYSYAIMSNHIHIVGHCKSVDGLSSFIRIVNSLFAKKYNALNNRRGQVCMERFKSPIIHTDEDMLRVMTYVDLNPVRANITQNPSDFEYSSYNYYAYGNQDDIISPSPAYLNLGENNEDRQRKYREIVDEIKNNTTKKKKKEKKENYSNCYFIGDPDWVAYKYQVIQKYRRGLKSYNCNDFNSS